MDDPSDKALWLEELVVSQGSEALKLLLVLGVHVNLNNGGHMRPEEARINFSPISWEPISTSSSLSFSNSSRLRGALLLALFSACVPSRRRGRWLTSPVGSSLSSAVKDWIKKDEQLRVLYTYYYTIQGGGCSYTKQEGGVVFKHYTWGGGCLYTIQEVIILDKGV